MHRTNNVLGYGLMIGVVAGWLIYLGARGVGPGLLAAMGAGGAVAIAIAGFISSRRSSTLW